LCASGARHFFYILRYKGIKKGIGIVNNFVSGLYWTIYKE